MIEVSQDQAQSFSVLRLDAGLGAGLVETRQPFVGEALNHYASVAFRDYESQPQGLANALARQADGRIDEALSEITTGQRLDPRSLVINADLAEMYISARRPVAHAASLRRNSR